MLDDGTLTVLAAAVPSTAAATTGSGPVLDFRGDHKTRESVY